jgi:hypothetical protein
MFFFVFGLCSRGIYVIPHVHTLCYSQLRHRVPFTIFFFGFGLCSRGVYVIPRVHTVKNTLLSRGNEQNGN